MHSVFRLHRCSALMLQLTTVLLLVSPLQGELTADARKTRTKIAPQPPRYPRIGNLGRTVTPSLAFDAKRNLLYVSRLGFPAYRLKR